MDQISESIVSEPRQSAKTISTRSVSFQTPHGRVVLTFADLLNKNCLLRENRNKTGNLDGGQFIDSTVLEEMAIGLMVSQC